MNKTNISQNELSRRTGISSATITKMRNGEYVSLEVLDRICSEFSCDYCDLITVFPPKNRVQIDLKGENIIKLGNDCFRTVLSLKMHVHSYTIQDVSERTGISVNTLKKFLSGNNVERRTLDKLLAIDCEFAEIVKNMINNQLSEKPIETHICGRDGNKKKYCRAYRTVFVPETKSYEGYCPFGCKQIINAEGKMAAIEDCPFPTTMYELMDATKIYEYKLRDKLTFIPAKDDID